MSFGRNIWIFKKPVSVKIPVYMHSPIVLSKTPNFLTILYIISAVAEALGFVKKFFSKTSVR